MNQTQQSVLVESLQTIFGEKSSSLISDTLPLLDWMELKGGQTLIQKNDTADAVYFVVSGRFRILKTDE
ncbi:MAG: cyclic nucleotide-binding domain-containing protein [Balneolaceae bacterium]